MWPAPETKKPTSSYWVVLGNFGPVSNFTKDGGAGIQARRVGSAPACDSPQYALSNPEV